MNSMNKRSLLCIMLLFLLLLSCSGLAFAEEPGNPSLIAEVTEIRPESNITVVEQATQPTEKGEREFLIIESRNGHFFYIVIDRSGSSEKAYFLNQVDEADLIELLKEEGLEEYAECVCDKKCINGAVNPECLVCRLDLDDCKGKSAAEPKKSTFSFDNMDNNTILIIGAAAGLAVLVIAYMSLKKMDNSPSKPKRSKSRAAAVKDDYDDDYYDDDDYDDYDEEDDE